MSKEALLSRLSFHKRHGWIPFAKSLEPVGKNRCAKSHVIFEGQQTFQWGLWVYRGKQHYVGCCSACSLERELLTALATLRPQQLQQLRAHVI